MKKISELHLKRYDIQLMICRFGLILPLFVPYYTEVPQTSGATFGGLSVSAKSMNYILGLQVIASSSSNVIVGLSAIVSIEIYKLFLSTLILLQKHMKIIVVFIIKIKLGCRYFLSQKSTLDAKVDLHSENMCKYL